MSTILVIDDDPALHHLIEGAVANDGLRLLHATSAEAAFALLARHQCQLLIFDQTVRGIEARPFLGRLRRLHPELKLILIAEATPPPTVLTALASKVCDLLVLPLTTVDLQTAIRGAIDECRLPEIEVLSAQQHWIQLRVPCDLNAVPVLQKLLTQLQADLPEETRDGMAYAFREMLNNAIEHGGRLDPSKHVEILCIRLKRALIYWIKDPGEGFNPAQLAHAAVSNPDHDPFRHVLVRDEQGLRAGGFGILLTNQLVDELVYNERCNELMFIKYI
jgi:anti-sigma regulatory factor (Ser/Thr protein kinase)